MKLMTQNEPTPERKKPPPKPLPPPKTLEEAYKGLTPSKPVRREAETTTHGEKE